jgi:hypothetical protein
MQRELVRNQNNSPVPPVSENLILDTDLVLSSDEFKKNIKYELQKTKLNEKSNIDKLNSVVEYPPPYIFGIFSSKVYETDQNDLPMGWQLLTTAFNEKNGYFGAAYWNSESHQIVIAHRGTDASKIDVLLTDLNGIVLNRYVSQMNSATTFADKLKRCLTELEVNFQLFFTGHSLGGWLAQITTFTSKYLALYDCKFQNAQEGYHAHTVVFDSPGCREMLLQMANDFSVRYKNESSLDVNSLDITSYLSAPNRINTYNTHIGKIYRIFTNLSDELNTNINLDSTYQKIRQFFGNYFNSGWIKEWYQYNSKAHSLDRILKEFDSNTGQVRKSEDGQMKIYDVVDWPTSSLGRGSEYKDFFKWVKDLKLSNYHAEDFKTMFCPIRYQTKPYNEKECRISVFTQPEQKFLIIYQRLREIDFFKSESLFTPINNEIAQKDAIDLLNDFQITEQVIYCQSAEKLQKLIPYVKLLLQLFPCVKNRTENESSYFGIYRKFYQHESNKD